MTKPQNPVDQKQPNKAVRKEGKVAEKVGRPKNQPNTVRFLVMSLFRAIDKAGKLDSVNAAEVIKKIKEKFPESKFDYTHFQWYFSSYRRMKNEEGKTNLNSLDKAIAAQNTSK